MLYTEIVFNIQKNFCTQHVLPHVLQKKELLKKIYLYWPKDGQNTNVCLGFAKFSFGKTTATKTVMRKYLVFKPS